jgi:acetyltransferase-like isoleucine patch superfamily enzyme
MLNVFSIRRKRDPEYFFARYTKDAVKRPDTEVGDYSYGKPVVLPEKGRKLRIGKFCSINDGVTIHLGGNHPTHFVSTYPFWVFMEHWPLARVALDERDAAVSRGELGEVVGSNGDVIIGNDVWMGTHAAILSGVTVGDGAVIGAYAVVTRDVEPYTIVGGIPARPIRKRFDDETIRRLLEIRWWDWPHEKIAANVNTIYSANVAKLLEL